MSCEFHNKMEHKMEFTTYMNTCIHMKLLNEYYIDGLGGK